MPYIPKVWISEKGKIKGTHSLTKFFECVPFICDYSIFSKHTLTKLMEVLFSHRLFVVPETSRIFLIRLFRP